ncbi:hypothetical protein GZ202_06295 [Dermatophilus congolensis]|nr:hypothetical protein [Dermatophilus congolensis]
MISNPLLDCLIEAEKHVAAAGWEQPPRLFALVHTTRLIEMEPALATQLGTPTDPTALSSIEQEGIETAFGHGPLTDPTNLDSLLSSLAWPEEVHGVALAIERLVLPPSAAENLPTQPEKLAQAAANHPDRIEVRLTAGVTRDGQATCLLRQRAHDTDDKVAIGHDIAPDLINALSTTLVPDEE